MAICSSSWALTMISSSSIISTGMFPNAYDTRLTLTKFMREYIMAKDIERDNIDFSCNTIDDLILADIRLNAIVKELSNYQSFGS